MLSTEILLLCMRLADCNQYESLSSFLEQAGRPIDIKICHGQSYDNASNMAGKFEGAQALLKRDCSVAHFIPCFGHSLNLAGNESAN